MPTTSEQSREQVPSQHVTPPLEQPRTHSFREIMQVLAEQSHMSVSRKASTVYELQNLAYRHKAGEKDLTGTPVSQARFGAVEKVMHHSITGTTTLVPMNYEDIKAVAAKKNIPEDSVDTAEMKQKAETLAAYGMLPTGWTPDTFSDEISKLEVVRVQNAQEYIKMAAEAEKKGEIIKVLVPGWQGVHIAGFANPNFGMKADFVTRFHGQKKGSPVPVDTGISVTVSPEKLADLSTDTFQPTAPEINLQNYGRTGLPIDPIDMYNAATADITRR